MKVRNVVLLLLVFGLAACSSTGPSPAAPAPKPAPTVVNLDNDFWFGTVTGPDSSNPVYVGVGFTQAGAAVTADLVLSDANGQAEYCCRLTGALTNNALGLNYTDAAGDQIKIDGTFGTDAKTLTGTLTFVLSGETSSYTLQLAYESELDAAALKVQSGTPLSVEAFAQQVR